MAYDKRNEDKQESRQASRDLGQYVDYEVIDRDDSKIGTLQCLWCDHTGEPAFIGVKTGWIFGKTHVVPADAVQVCEGSARIRLPYTKEKVKDAPAYDAETEMDEAREWEIRTYYGISQPKGRQPASTTESSHQQRATPEQATIKLSEEELKVGKRQVEAGGVRLRKIIRTETINQPIELQREEIVIERVPGEQAKAVQQKSFQEADIFIPLRREEAVIEKQEHIREEVRVRKKKRTDKQQVSERVRREDVEIEPSGEAREDRGRSNPAEEIREREDVPRSRRRHE
jgi:uncharacterized protein (TIGR02271 family)